MRVFTSTGSPVGSDNEECPMKTSAVAVAALLVIAFLANGCAGKYADIKKAQGDFSKQTEAYVAQLEKADTAKAVAKAVNNYADALEKVWPQMRKLSEKYPELQDKENPPKELEATLKEAEAAGQKMASSFMKLMPYMSDPDVQKAQQRLSVIMMAE
jgi:type I site-specific restriction-modification system R (restriction) subunit